MAEEAFGRRLPFAFLDELKNRFKATYGDRGKTALSFAMQADFSRIMQNLMVCCSSYHLYPCRT
jgi:vesicle-associated membrane protein 7